MKGDGSNEEKSTVVSVGKRPARDRHFLPVRARCSGDARCRHRICHADGASAHVHQNADCYAYSHAYVDRDCHADGDCYADGDANRHANAYPYSDADGAPYTYSCAHAGLVGRGAHPGGSAGRFLGGLAR
jgi:hypothetical protein